MAGDGMNADQIALAAQKLRSEARASRWTEQTSGCAPGALQANLAVVPADAADEFAAFCRANPKPCPLLDVTSPGGRHFARLGADVDAATDLPAYRVLKDGVAAETVHNLEPYWRGDFRGFALGCSYSFEDALQRAGVPMRHIDRNANVTMFISGIETTRVGRFGGPMVVSMRPIPAETAPLVREICARYPLAHGAPVHIGPAAAIGVADVARPDFGEPADIRDGDVLAFWACGVTPQVALREARLPLAFTHEPGCMLVTDLDAADPELALRLAA